MARKQLVKEYFDDYAKYWHSKLDVYGFKARRDCVSKYVRDVAFTSVLDIGCGCGDYAPLFDADQYIGIDISEKMVSKARELYPGYKFEVGDAEGTGMTPGAWDFVLSVAVLEYLEDPHPHMSELSRLLRKDGMCIVCVQNGEDRSKQRDERLAERLSSLSKMKGRLLSSPKGCTLRPPVKDSRITHLRYSEEEMRDLGARYALRLVGRSFVNISLMPSLVDQYLHINPFISRLLDGGVLGNLFHHYVRSYSRCLTVVFQKIH